MYTHIMRQLSARARGKERHLSIPFHSSVKIIFSHFTLALALALSLSLSLSLSIPPSGGRQGNHRFKSHISSSSAPPQVTAETIRSSPPRPPVRPSAAIARPGIERAQQQQPRPRERGRQPQSADTPVRPSRLSAGKEDVACASACNGGGGRNERESREGEEGRRSIGSKTGIENDREAATTAAAAANGAKSELGRVGVYKYTTAIVFLIVDGGGGDSGGRHCCLWTAVSSAGRQKPINAHAKRPPRNE